MLLYRACSLASLVCVCVCVCVRVFLCCACTTSICAYCRGTIRCDLHILWRYCQPPTPLVALITNPSWRGKYFEGYIAPQTKSRSWMALRHVHTLYALGYEMITQRLFICCLCEVVCSCTFARCFAVGRAGVRLGGTGWGHDAVQWHHCTSKPKPRSHILSVHPSSHINSNRTPVRRGNPPPLCALTALSRHDGPV